MNQKFYNLNPQFYLKLWDNERRPIISKQDPAPTDNKFKKASDFQISLKKALSGKHTAILFDESFLDNENLNSYLKASLNKNIQPVLLITNQAFKDKKARLKMLSEKQKNQLVFHIFFDEWSERAFKDIKELSLQKTFFVYVVTKKNKGFDLKQNLPKEVLEKLYFYFPYKESLGDLFLRPKQVYKFIKTQGPCSAYPVEIYDRQIAQDMSLEPLIKPFAKNELKDSKKNIYISVIIPSYNNKRQVLNTLRCLALQNYRREEYEIIAVDDGSSDGTRKALKYFMGQYPSLNFKAIHFPRVIERKPGDSRYRAGLARNLAVKYSQGKFLAFLDSDILVPPNYLKQLKREHESADVVLLKRYHLKAQAPLQNLFFDHRFLKKFCYIEEKNYWGNFYKKGFDKVKSPWKYVCTYALSLSKKNFEWAGGFGKNFTSYGFEDTDLAYKLFNQNKKFLLSSLWVYHQAPTQKGAWPHPLSRQKSLAKTAKVFFYKHLDPKIYEEMKIYMTQTLSWSYFFPFFKKSGWTGLDRP